MSETEAQVAALERVACGELAAFRYLYNATAPKLFGIILRILRERGEAEDVLQEVYTTVWRKAAAFDPTRASPIAWMAIIARNRAIDRLRARGRLSVVPLEAAAEIGDGSAGADELVIASDAVRRLMATLSTLDQHHARAICSMYFEGLTYQELAERDGIPVGTLKSWVRRGLIRLRGELVA